MKLSLSTVIAVVLGIFISSTFSAQPRTMARIVFHEERGNKPVDPNTQTYQKLLIAGDSLLRAEVIVGGTTQKMLIRNGVELWEAMPQTRTAVLRDTTVKTMSLTLFSTSKNPFVHGLQVGKEMEFFQKRKALPSGEEKLDTLSCQVYSTDSAGTKLQLWVDKKRHVPVQVAVSGPQSEEYRVKYDVYMPEVPFDSTVFRVPKRPPGMPIDTTTQSPSTPN